MLFQRITNGLKNNTKAGQRWTAFVFGSRCFFYKIQVIFEL
jgi:hypothetical protein